MSDVLIQEVPVGKQFHYYVVAKGTEGVYLCGSRRPTLTATTVVMSPTEVEVAKKVSKEPLKGKSTASPSDDLEVQATQVRVNATQSYTVLVAVDTLHGMLGLPSNP
jgi:hypothetical protein